MEPGGLLARWTLLILSGTVGGRAGDFRFTRHFGRTLPHGVGNAAMLWPVIAAALRA